MNWESTQKITAPELFADAQRLWEADVRACYMAWTLARQEALFHYMERLALAQAHEDYAKDEEAGHAEANAYAESWGGEHVRPDAHYCGYADTPLTAHELRELRHDQATDKLDAAQAKYHARVFPGR